MAISGVGQSYYQNNVATTKSTKSVNSTGETGNTILASQAIYRLFGELVIGSIKI